MNFKKWTTALMLALAVSSCIQDEALNSEAAIDACTGADVQLAHINSDSKEINIYVHKGANLAKQQLLFTLPDGATIKADEHSPNDILNNYDFSNESHSRTFTVTSEDGEWTATYTVKVVPAEMPETFHFEDLLPSAGTEYDIFYEFEPGTSTSVSRVAQWSSGNPGYKLPPEINLLGVTHLRHRKFRSHGANVYCRRKPVYRFLRPGKRTERSSACHQVRHTVLQTPHSVEGLLQIQGRRSLYR